MGCCSDPTFEEAVRKEIMRFINSTSMSSTQRNSIIKEINDDLAKKNAAFEAYHYDYREDDVTKVVNEYKNKIERRLNKPITKYEEVVDLNQQQNTNANNANQNNNNNNNQNNNQNNNNNNNQNGQVQQKT